MSGTIIDNDTEPRIYVADLHAYNCAHLRGTWVKLWDFYHDDPDRAADRLMHHISELLEEWDADLLDGMTGPVEEYAIHDYEGFPSSLYSEHMGRQAFRRVFGYMVLQDEADPDAVNAYFDGEYADHLEPGEWLSDFGDRYRGSYDEPADWAYSMLADLGLFRDLPDMLPAYFDFEAYARDQELGGCLSFIESGGQVHVFHDC